MKKKITVALTFILLATILFSSCAEDYSAIEPTEEEDRLVAIADGYAVHYDEFRYTVLANRAMLESSGAPDLSDEEAKENYRTRLYEAVLTGIRHNASVRSLLSGGGHSLDSLAGTENETMKALIDECGGRQGYIEYLKENNLTDRLVRQNLRIAAAENELMYILNDLSVFDEYFPFDFTRLSTDRSTYYKALEFVYTSDIYVKFEYIAYGSEVADREAMADAALLKLEGGADMESLADGKSSTYYAGAYVKGECSGDFFNSVLRAEEDKATVFEANGTLYLLRRLPIMQDVNAGCRDIVMKYVRVLTLEYIDNYAKKIDMNYTDFGKSLDILEIK